LHLSRSWQTEASSRCASAAASYAGFLQPDYTLTCRQADAVELPRAAAASRQIELALLTLEPLIEAEIIAIIELTRHFH